MTQSRLQLAIVLTAVTRTDQRDNIFDIRRHQRGHDLSYARHTVVLPHEAERVLLARG